MKNRREAQEEKKRKRLRVIVSVSLILLMVLSTAGFYFDSAATGTRYNGHKITYVSNSADYQYQVKVDGTIVQFYSAPTDSLSLDMPSALTAALQSAQGVVFLFDPTDNQTAYYDRVRWDFQKAFDPKPVGAAVTQAPSVDSPYQFPVASCADARAEYPIILFRTGSQAITYEQGCFVFQGEVQDLLLIRDRVLYAYYGITQ